ncbi:hypothetical protein GCM10025867_06280 [Frondihabitans sucicola]|uniref:Uncharacterized protein n=1 Tax=Frondihabitans sucicola TaxID=1268041 RepID=A0ABN6XTQ1_9MICO|nr:hypothetical protein GCM10025867_06280 [Frondihabitans sucicola]
MTGVSQRVAITRTLSRVRVASPVVVVMARRYERADRPRVRRRARLVRPETEVVSVRGWVTAGRAAT